MSAWQSLIADAAIGSFSRTGKVGVFHLKRGDMVRLVSEIAGLQLDPSAWDEYVAVKCLVKCEALGRAVEVREWTA